MFKYFNNWLLVRWLNWCSTTEKIQIPITSGSPVSSSVVSVDLLYFHSTFQILLLVQLVYNYKSEKSSVSGSQLNLKHSDTLAFFWVTKCEHSLIKSMVIPCASLSHIWVATINVSKLLVYITYHNEFQFQWCIIQEKRKK